MPGYNPPIPTTHNKGFWDADTNVPDYEVVLTATEDYLIVSTAGTQTIDAVEIEFAEAEYLVKIDSGFSKISPTDPSFTGFTDGDFIKVVNGVATKADMRQIGDAILMGETARTKQGSIGIGTGNTLSEYGGIFLSKSTVTSSEYHPVLSQYKAGDIDLLSNKKAHRLEVGTSADIVVQAVDTTELLNVTSVTYTSLAYLNETTKVYFDFANTVTNLRFRVKRADTGAVIKYFPSEFAWLDGVGGNDVVATGKQEVYPLGDTNGTPMLFPASTDYIIEMVADTAINLNGSALLPWLKVTAAPAEFIELADADDIPSATSASEASAVNTITTSSTSDVLVANMTLTPGAGNYVAFFSCSAKNSDDETTYISLYANDVKIAASDRRFLTEGSIPNTPIPMCTQAYIVSLGAGETITAKWRTTNNTATMYERTLTLIKVD